MNERHVYPLDGPKHVLDGNPCWCQPTVKNVGLTGRIIIHRRVRPS